MRTSRRPVVAAILLLVAVLGVAPAAGQDLDVRRGFAVRIVEPPNEDIVSGPTKIVAEVEARDPANVVKLEFFIDDELVFTDAEPPYQLVHDFGVKAGVHVIRVVAHHRSGVTVSDFVVTRALDINYVVNVQRVVLDVAVRDRDRRLVPGLPPDAFRVFEDGREQRIIEVSPEERPILVGLLLDSSGSMRERIEDAQTAGCRFVEQLRDDDRAFVIDFDEAVYLLEETTSDRERLCASIRSTEAIGGTALYDAIHAAFRVINRIPAERKAFVILSDGEDTSSSIKFEKLREEALASEVTIYAIGLDVGAGEARSVLRRLSDDTGGRAWFVKRSEDLEETYAKIAEELRSLYQVVYASDHDLDGSFVRVQVQVVDAEGRKLDVRHRRGYYAMP
ncbi:MAG: VWA domain-containing protein [Acidobacteria bacterium]|nr:MAG: VWA domain-containing protein [Acidobacteriota bacterium]